MDRKKREREIAKWIGQPCKLPSSNKDEEAENKKEDFGTTQELTEYNYPINEDDEGCEYN